MSALLRANPSLGYVEILLLLHFYVYSAMGVITSSMVATRSTIEGEPPDEEQLEDRIQGLCHTARGT